MAEKNKAPEEPILEKVEADAKAVVAAVAGRFKAKQRLVNIAPNGTDQTVIEEGQVVDADHPFVALHPAQFEAV